jgi:hypothetical protein
MTSRRQEVVVARLLREAWDDYWTARSRPETGSDGLAAASAGLRRVYEFFPRFPVAVESTLFDRGLRDAARLFEARALFAIWPAGRERDVYLIGPVEAGSRIRAAGLDGWCAALGEPLCEPPARIGEAGRLVESFTGDDLGKVAAGPVLDSMRGCLDFLEYASGTPDAQGRLLASDTRPYIRHSVAARLTLEAVAAKAALPDTTRSEWIGTTRLWESMIHSLIQVAAAASSADLATVRLTTRGDFAGLAQKWGIDSMWLALLDGLPEAP